MSSVLTVDNLEKVQKLFKSEEEYRKAMKSLWKTRSGLMRINEVRPDLKKEIFPQMEILNNLIDAFYNSDLEHPIYGLDPESESCNEELLLN